MDTKKQIRTQIKKIRDQITPEEWQEATDRITEKVIQSDAFREETDVYCYMNFGSEVGTLGIINEAWRLGKNVWLPKVLGDRMEFYSVHGIDELKKSTYGIMEPEGDDTPASGADGLMIVPGVAFDRNGERIGYGGGYYDRYLAAHPNLITVAVAFDRQLLERIPSEEQDQKIKKIVTETLILGGTKNE